MKVYKIFGVLVLLLVFSCVTNPITGRKSLQIMPNSQLNAMALEQYNQVLSTTKVITGTADAKKVENVGERIKKAAERYYRSIGREQDLSSYNWEFHLIDDKQLNAWCMPGGKVAFYSGIMPVCKDETGVAVVMGHEISHALAGHGNERITSAMIAQGIGIGAGLAMKDEKMRKVFSIAYPLGAQATLLAYSRKQESEADEMGLYLMAMAGYDPRKAVDFWQRMGDSSGARKMPEFLATHPNPEHRRADLNAHMERAMQYYRQYKGR
ncbi:M48 family metallopeptidase [Riemerella columbipharyngis]|uniref:Peptidase family M48 n=1 Tax=Riemerella columbipharyngis TaxID=1071918 RepID=A0A1G7E5R4_9FLAO|nr:M48 family metallopeptidase [Riemerella columbipharyngis]SDE59013.1 Peptidase family M48 [Riemerella columbipharyngis]